MNTAYSLNTSVKAGAALETGFLAANLSHVFLSSIDSTLESAENLLGLAGPLVVAAQDYSDEISLI